MIWMIFEWLTQVQEGYGCGVGWDRIECDEKYNKINKCIHIKVNRWINGWIDGFNRIQI